MQDTTVTNPFSTIPSEEIKRLELTAQLEYLKNQREKYAKNCVNQAEEKLSTFREDWIERIKEKSIVDVTSLNDGIRIYAWTSVYGKLKVSTYRESILFHYLNESYSFELIDKDEDADIDIHSFVTSFYRMHFNEVPTVNFLWECLNELIYDLIHWYRQKRLLFGEIKDSLEKANVELKEMDQEITRIRSAIRELKVSEFLNGKPLVHVKERYGSDYFRFWFKYNRYEFVKSVRVIQKSPSGKTYEIEAVITPKERSYHFYYPINSNKWKTIRIKGIRRSTVASNFSLPTI